jgi:cytochrome P450/2-polyprenyl-3-methyl-5-hydroxy-6-metoxy-1,4-benzoquinol methylase
MQSPRFDAVDRFNPTACIEFLDHARSIAEVDLFKQRSRALLQLASGYDVLEVGCGTGADACALAQHVGPTGRVTGIDSSRAMIEEARRRAAGVHANVAFEQADVCALPFPDGHFHCSRADRLLHLLERPAAALDEIVRVTRVGGRVVVGEPDWESLSIEGGESRTTAIILEHGRAKGTSSTRIGAHLVPLFVDAGLDVEQTIPEPLDITDFDLSMRLFNLGNFAYNAVVAGRISTAVARNWFDSLAQASANGEFMCSFTGYTVAGIKHSHTGRARTTTAIVVPAATATVPPAVGERMKADAIDLTSPDFRANPYPTYAALRRAGGLHWLPHGGATGGMWLVTQYDGVAEILKQRHISKHAGASAPSRRCPFDHNLLAQDAPDHTRIRGLVLRAFTSERIATLAPAIESLVDELIDRMIARSQADFVAEFAMVLPAFVIADLLGVPREDRTRFSAWSRDLLTGPDVSNPRLAQSAAGIAALTGYFRALVAQRRQAPSDDLIGALVRECDAQGAISEDEMLATLILMLVAGHETTVNMLSNGLWALLTFDDEYQRLKRNPGLMQSAIEEMLRFESPVQRATFRVTTEAMTICGVTLEKGQQVSAIIGSANRDPARFDQPDRLDIGRQPNRHIAFGLGIHACLGPALARLEGKIAFERLLARVPRLRLVDLQPNWNVATTAVRGLTSLPIQLS